MGSFDKFNGLWPSQKPRRLRLRFICIWKVCILHFCIIFKLIKSVFFAAKQLIFQHVPWKQHPKSNEKTPNLVLHEHYAIFYVFELYSTNQIRFCQIKLCSIICHFLVNKLYLITYSNFIVEPLWKKSTWN